MNADELKCCSDREVDAWCRKGYSALLKELGDVVAYESCDGPLRFQVEVQLIEKESDYLHVIVSVDDGGWRAFKPLSYSFIVHRDGRVER